jgi:hypothetical protein
MLPANSYIRYVTTGRLLTAPRNVPVKSFNEHVRKA